MWDKLRMAETILKREVRQCSRTIKRMYLVIAEVLNLNVPADRLGIMLIRRF